ncbi:MAG: discoidin domain-containing protein [Verrucomicrobiota bacterium]
MSPALSSLSLFLAAWSILPTASVERLDQERQYLERRIAGLPERRPFAPSTAVGFHSRWIDKPNAPLSVTIDLRETQPLDTIFVVPAFAPSGWGYGFPMRYRVEVSTDSAFANPLILLDRTTVDHPIPKGPIEIPSGGVSARWIRFTATKLQRQPNWEQGYMFCLGEILAFSRGRNIALGANVDASTSQRANYPTWTPQNLVDGITSLGLPVEPDVHTTKTLHSGWHSLESPNPDTPKWVQVDLGREYSLQEIRAIPANPVTFTNRPGFGFPVRFKIELSATPDFESPILAVDHTQSDYPNPGDNVASWGIPDLKGRYIRFTATQLFLRWNDFVFALAELEVISGGVNVARTGTVSCPEKTPNENFQPEYLVDGQSSSGLLIDSQTWLSALALRANLEQQLTDITERETQARKDETRRWSLFAWIGVGLALSLGIGLSWRARRNRLQQLQNLRKQIARDLHDEIGSSLGSIALISELGKQDHDLSALAEIHQLAVDAADSMRGILWMIKDGSAPSLAQLEDALRTQAEQALRGFSLRFQSQGEAPVLELPLSFHRNVFLFFKESLHNIARHSDAKNVSVIIAWSPRTLQIEVIDDGKGFDMEAHFAGSGLANMQHRSNAANAALFILSAPGKGTHITLDAALL